MVGGCNSAASKKEESLRVELRLALRDRSFEKAAALARQLLKLKSQDNDSWDRLVEAQLGMGDVAGAKQTLADWRKTVSQPSFKLDEYAGDLAFGEHDLSVAIESWTKVLGSDPKNVRILEKVARLQQQQGHWTEEDAAWTAHISAQDNATARVNRALCRRHLHRWQDAFEDLNKARELAPDDPEVQRGARLFERVSKFLAEIRELDAALAASSNDPGLLTDRALMFLRSEDYDLALEDSEAALKFGSWAVRPKLFQAIALIALGRSDECQKLSVQAFVRLDALTPEFLEAMARLDSEISVERNNAELHVARAWQLNEIGQPALALKDAEVAAHLDAKLASAFAESSYALMKLGRAAEALEQIKRATTLDPNSSTAWEYRGELEMEKGELLSAIESLTHALEHAQTATTLQKREQCFRRLGLHAKAERDHRALEALNAGAPK